MARLVKLAPGTGVVSMVALPERPEDPAASSEGIAEAPGRAIVELQLPPGAKPPGDEPAAGRRRRDRRAGAS